MFTHRVSSLAANEKKRKMEENEKEKKEKGRRKNFESLSPRRGQFRAKLIRRDLARNYAYNWTKFHGSMAGEMREGKRWTRSSGRRIGEKGLASKVARFIEEIKANHGGVTHRIFGILFSSQTGHVRTSTGSYIINPAKPWRESDKDSLEFSLEHAIQRIRPYTDDPSRMNDVDDQDRAHNCGVIGESHLFHLIIPFIS